MPRIFLVLDLRFVILQGRKEIKKKKKNTVKLASGKNALGEKFAAVAVGL